MATVLLSDRARLFDLRDELEALRIRLAWSNETLRRCPNPKIKRLRDVYAMNLTGSEAGGGQETIPTKSPGGSCTKSG